MYILKLYCDAIDFEGKNNNRQRQYTSSTISNEHIQIRFKDFLLSITDNLYKKDNVYSNDLSINTAANSVTIEIQVNLRLDEVCGPDFNI